MHRIQNALQAFGEAMNAAVEAHGLTPGSFNWLHGEVRHPMEPQPILAAPWATLHDYYTSIVTVYGGRFVNRRQERFDYGRVQGGISQATPPGVKHRSNEYDPPVPYIAHVLTIKDGTVTVSTPEEDEPVGQGPVVFEGMGGHGRFRTVTCYDSRSGTLTVRSGNYVTDGHGWSDDQTVAEDALHLPTDVIEQRITTMTTVLTDAADILTRVAQRDAETRCDVKQ